MNSTRQYLEEKYRQLYGNRDCSVKIKKQQKQQKQRYLLVGIAFLCAFLLNVDQQYQLGNMMRSNKAGLYALQRPKEGEPPVIFETKVLIETKQGKFERVMQVTVESVGDQKDGQTDSAYGGQESYQDKIEREIASALSAANQNKQNKNLVLPIKLENGEQLHWESVNSWNIPFYLAGLLGVCYLLYKGRFQSIKNEQARAKKSVIRELPDFTNKLILLLNAGVVLNTALDKIINDWKNVSKKENYFYDQLNDIFKSVNETNSAVHEEFKQFAKRSGVRELMRVSNVISDNVYKGAGLIDKLQKENQMLWFSRKQQAEESGRLAETKLTIPLVILLLVLVLITIAPALMGM